jgi:hypothetical protein
MERLRQLAAKLALPPLKSKRADEVFPPFVKFNTIYPSKFPQAFPELMRNWLPLSSTIVRACARGRSAQKAFQMDDGRLREMFLDETTAAANSMEIGEEANGLIKYNKMTQIKSFQ